MMRRLLALFLLAFPAAASGQERGFGESRYHATLSVDRVRVYRGDPGSPIWGWGAVGSGGVRSTSSWGVEALIGFVAKDADSFHRDSPWLFLPGAVATYSVTSAPFPELLFGAGFAGMFVAGWPDYSACRRAPDCFIEGGPAFQDGAGLSLVLVGGLSHRIGRRLLIRGDARLIEPNRVSGHWLLWLGLGVGLVVP